MQQKNEQHKNVNTSTALSIGIINVVETWHSGAFEQNQNESSWQIWKEILAYFIYSDSISYIYIYVKKCSENTYKLTVKGCLISSKMFFSFFTCSVCFNLITSVIANNFMAQYVFAYLSLHKQTLPNVPVPIMK